MEETGKIDQGELPAAFTRTEQKVEVTPGNIEKPVECHARHAVNPAFRSVLADTKVGTVALKGSKVIVCKEDDTVVSAFQKLVEHKVLSLPVCSPNLDKFYGFLDILDIVTYVSGHISKPTGENQLVQPWYTIREIADTPCKDIMNLSKRNSTMAVDVNSSIQTVIDDIAFDNYHRIVLTQKGIATTVLTQTNILDFLFQHSKWNEMGSLSGQTVDGLQLGIRKVLTVTKGTQVLQAFKDIVKYQVSALAIVDENNKLIGNISASDIKAIGYDMGLYARIFTTVGDFLKDQLKKGPITVTPQHKLGDVLKLFHSKSVHRLYITDSKHALLGVITPNDILKCFRSRHLMEKLDTQYKQTQT